MPVYRTKGQLIHAIPSEGVAAAQRYLKEDAMAQYLDPPLYGNVEFLEWNLEGNGLDYTITAVVNRVLTESELKQLSSECSGQNSDGLGEGFEQQDFAWLEDEEYEEDCSYCNGMGKSGVEGDDDDDEDADCEECYGEGTIWQGGEGVMCSFDWKTNDLPWERIA